MTKQQYILYEHTGENLMNENSIFYISYMKNVHISYKKIEFSVFLIPK